MTPKQFNVLWLEAANYSSRDAYVSDLALSSIWGDDPDAQIPKDRIDLLGDIYDAAHRSVRDIAAAAGLSHRKLAERFCIPYRTMENWCGGQSSCPSYILLMMQECLGLLPR